MKNFKLDLTDVLEWGFSDVEELNEYINDYIKLTGGSVDDILDEIEGMCGDKTEINIWFFAVINLIWGFVYFELSSDFNVFEVAEAVGVEEDAILSLLDKLHYNFSPYINCLDSWFNNFLDEAEDLGDFENIKDAFIKYAKSELLD